MLSTYVCACVCVYVYIYIYIYIYTHVYILIYICNNIVLSRVWLVGKGLVPAVP